MNEKNIFIDSKGKQFLETNSVNIKWKYSLFQRFEKADSYIQNRELKVNGSHFSDDKDIKEKAFQQGEYE